MFNFKSDSSAVSMDMASTSVTVSMPRWTVLFDSKSWALIVPE
ncbi:hypothetical protein [Litorimonas sp. WD9-15]